jgi:hypothetical protein
MSEDKCRKWFCRISKINNTQFGIYEYDFDEIYNKLTEKYNNILFAIHDKDTSNIHCHIIIQNETQIRFNTLKNILPYGDIEKQRGSNKECYEYCLHIDKKSLETEKDQYDETCIKTNIEDLETWKKLDNKLGARNDLTQIVEDIKNGANKYDILDNYPSQYVRYSDAFLKVQQELLEKENVNKFRELKITYIYGSTGVGKTRYVMEKYGYENVYRATNYDSGAFDGYNGQDVILFDEFRSSIPIASMLTYLDGYPICLPCRYRNKYALFTKVYIISNIPLSKQYLVIQTSEPKTYDAFLRRITEVYNFDKSKKIPESTKELKLIPLDVDADDIF